MRFLAFVLTAFIILNTRSTEAFANGNERIRKANSDISVKLFSPSLFFSFETSTQNSDVSLA